MCGGERGRMPIADAKPKVDKLEQMLGSYAPSPDGSPYTKKFQEEEAPSGMIARSGTYNVRSRVVDDDGEIYAGKCSRVSYYCLARGGMLLCGHIWVTKAEFGSVRLSASWLIVLLTAWKACTLFLTSVSE